MPLPIAPYDGVSPMKHAALRAAMVCAFLAVAPSVWAQHAQEEFGRNRIQYGRKAWKYVASRNFDLYYYDDRERVANQSINYLEEEFDRITNLIGYLPQAKIKLFLYNSLFDLQQTNVGLEQTRYSTADDPVIITPYAELACVGTLDELKDRLLYKITELLIREMTYGSSFKDMIKNAVLLNLPEWFIPGAARYVAKGWSSDMDDYVRQLVYSKRVRKISHFKGEEAALVGQSVWNYIYERYGDNGLSGVLNYTRVVGNARKGISVILGTNFQEFIDKWCSYYQETNAFVNRTYESPGDTLRALSGGRKGLMYTDFKISPDGKRIAYTQNSRGRFSVRVRTIDKSDESVVLSGGYRLLEQEVNYRMPLIGWVNSNTLGVIGRRRDKHLLWLYDLSKRVKQPRVLQDFDNIVGLDFSHTGKLGVISADRDGQNDLFLISTYNDRVKRLTRDVYDDIDPSFFPGTNVIAFSSNRPNDSIQAAVSDVKALEGYNIYSFNLDDADQPLKRITNALGRNYNPQPYNQNTIYYLSDQRGIANVFRYDIDSRMYFQVTHFNVDLERFDFDFSNRKLAFTTLNRLKSELFIAPNFDLDQQRFEPETPRMLSRRIKTLRARKKVPPASAAPSIVSVPAPSPPTKAKRSVKELVHQQLEAIETADSLRQLAAQSDSISAPADNTVISADDYTFEDAQQDHSAEQFLSRYAKRRDKARLEGPFPYKPLFNYRDLGFELTMDPLFGLGIRLGIQMSDMLENYHFSGAVNFSFDGESNQFFAEARYLPHRVDYSLRVDRRAVFWRGTQNYQYYTWQKVEFGLSLPLSTRWRIAAKPFIGFTSSADRGQNQLPLPTPPIFHAREESYYGGAQAELVYDNSLITGVNIIEGTRGKISITHYQNLGNERLSFSRAFIDLRHYQKIFRDASIALRGYAGVSFGPAPKSYVLGGLDNWLFNARNTEGRNNPLAPTEGYNRNLIFTEFATGLRGFDYAAMHGNNVAMANVELRLPLVRLLSTNPISSNFLKNIQLIAFYDIGTAWSGPLSVLETGPTTRVVPSNESTGNPFQAEIADFLNPWLYSYGLGLRAKILGFYTKFDVAWPVQNYRVNPVRFHATLGVDF